jgi:hypothetical protein
VDKQLIACGHFQSRCSANACTGASDQYLSHSAIPKIIRVYLSESTRSERVNSNLQKKRLF